MKTNLSKIFTFLFVVLLSFTSIGILTVNSQQQYEWVTKTPIPTYRYAFGLATVNEKIFVIGGTASNGSTTLTNNEMYDPNTNKWETRTPIPTPRRAYAITAYQNKIYCIGGINTFANEVYDPTTDTWTTKAPLPTQYNRYFFNAHTVKDKIYVIGGLTTKLAMWSNNSPEVNIYDPKTDSWEYGTQKNRITYYPVVTATTGEYAPKKIYVFGSERLYLNFPDYNSYLVGQSYDLQTGNWTQFTPIPNGHLNGGAVVIDDIIYLVGGGMGDWFIGVQIKPRDYITRYTPFLFGSLPEISITSPENKIYSQATIPLKFLVNDSVVWMGYSLDNQENVTITREDYWFSAENIFGTNLTRLSEGTHKLTVYGRDHVGDEGSSSVTFTVDTLPPILTFLSPQNQSYTDANITLSVNLNEAVSDLKYSLDEFENVTFTGNATLSDFEYGEHNVVIYATDLAGHSSISEILYFSVEPFPTTLVLTSAVIIAIVGLGIEL